MPKHTVPYARNNIRRTLRAIVDPEPSASEVDEIWAYFRSSCAYCGVNLQRKQRMGHIDHLIAWAAGGSNHTSNRVLACRSCNSDEKLDSAWQSFLRLKSQTNGQRLQRETRIRDWTTMNGNPPMFDHALVDGEATRAIKAFNGCVERIRQTKG